MQGVKWSTLSTIANMLLQLFFMAIMARLLAPSAFGLVAIAMVTLRFAGYFAQMGIGPALVQKKTLEEPDISAAFFLSVSLGATASGVVFILAPTIGKWMGSDQLEDVIQVLAGSFILTGLSTVPIYLLRRELRFKALAFVESTSYLLGYGTCGVVLALNGAGVWSLVGAALCQGLITLSLSHFFARHPIIFVFERKALKHFFNFGSRYSVVGFLEFIGSNLDTIVIGKVLGGTSTGIYNRAFMLTNLPVQNIINSITKVLFPILSEVQNDRNLIGQVYLLFVFLVGSLTGSICFGMIPASNDLVLTMLGRNWEASIPIVKVLAVSVPFVFLSHIAGIILDALAELEIKLVIQSASLFVLMVAMYFLADFGLIGFASAVVITEIFKSVAYFMKIRILLSPPIDILKEILFYIVTIVSVTVAAIWLTVKLSALGDLPHWCRLIMEISVGACSLIVLFLVAWSRLDQLQICQKLNSRYPLLLRLSNSIRVF